MSSLFTSVYPSVHRAEEFRFSLNEEFTTLAEALKQRGYVTAAFMTLPSLNRKFGMNQGFDLYKDDLGFWKEEGVFKSSHKIRQLLKGRGRRGDRRMGP